MQKVDFFERVAKYNYGMTAKIILGDEDIKLFYAEIENLLRRYTKVSKRDGWKHETFNYKRECIVKMTVRGKTLSVFTADSASEYENSAKLAETVHTKNTYSRFPYCHKISNKYRLKLVLRLITNMLEKRGAVQSDVEPVDYSKLLKSRSVEQLVVEGLVKHVKQTDFKTVETVKSTEVNELLDDASAKEEVVELVTRPKKNDKYKLEIVNIDTISQHFENGETVTLEEVKNRVPFFNRRATALKVLARGELDKKLTFVADDYSMDAIKMILLVGGTVVRNKKQ